MRVPLYQIIIGAGGDADGKRGCTRAQQKGCRIAAKIGGNGGHLALCLLKGPAKRDESRWGISDCLGALLRDSNSCRVKSPDCCGGASEAQRLAVARRKVYAGATHVFGRK
jgi:hypothetical protein